MSDPFDHPQKGVGSRFPGGFRAMVTRELAALGHSVKRWHDDGLDYTGPDGKSNFIGLGNLYRRVKTHEPDESTAIVRHFLSNLVGNSQTLEQMPTSLQEAEAQLMLRIGQPFGKLPGAMPWFEPLVGTPLHLNLVMDFPQTMAYVTQEMMSQATLPPEHWLSVATQHLRDKTPADWLQTPQEDDPLRYGHLNDSYDAARALLLCERTGNDPAGWLVAIPTRDWLFAMKVELSNLAHFSTLKNLAGMYFKKHPYPISDEVFWVRPDQPWSHFPIERTEKGISITPPEGFLEAIQAVDPSGDAEPG